MPPREGKKKQQKKTGNEEDPDWLSFSTLRVFFLLYVFLRVFVPLW
jgi:hypothetical protein